MSSTNQHVQVYIRIKPTDKFAVENIELLPDSKELIIRAGQDKVTGYINNQILDWNFRTNGVLHNVSQDEVFHTCASKQVSLALEGYNATLFMYGQTGAGKTYTMTGTTNNFEQRGIIPRAINQLFSEISSRKEYKTTVRISYLEVYKEQMFDLLATVNSDYSYSCSELSITEDPQSGTYVKGLSCLIAKNEEDALNMLFEGESIRVVSEHKMNRLSSRSHCIFTIYMESHCITKSETKYIRSKLNLVDLAGSERLGKSLVEGEAKEEALYINKSLTFLEQTIISLEDKHRYHVPYRQSKLTHVLKDSLGGKCSTVMIGNIWGEKQQLEETLSTLRFGMRAMNVPTRPAVNSYQDPNRLCKKYEKEILHLKRELAMYDTLTNRNQVNYEPLSDIQVRDIRQQVRKYLDNDTTDIEVVNLRQIQEVFKQFKYYADNAERELVRSKDKHLLSGKSESAEKGNENSQLISERVGLVGDPDGNGFGVGRVSDGVKPAPSSAVANSRKKNKKFKDSPEIERKAASPSVLMQNSVTLQADMRQAGEDQSICAVTATQADLDSPPARTEAFEMYKAEHGSALNKVFMENKETLHKKKCEAKRLSQVINKTKKEIDQTKNELNAIDEKDCEQETTLTGEAILDEDEYELLCKLSSYKKNYRENYDFLQNIRSDIVYCEHLVKQCRKKLMLDFDTWYASSFRVKEQADAGDSVSVKGATKVIFQPKEDDGEKFDKIQKQLLMNNPESVAFYNARIQTERRKLYGNTLAKRPGSVTSSIRNAPPKTMIIH